LVETNKTKSWKVGINAANIAWPQEFGIDPTTNYGNWIFAIVNAGVYFSSALFGCWLSDPLNNFFGRRGCVLFAAVFSFTSSFGAAVTQTWWQLLLCRCLLGTRLASFDGSPYLHRLSKPLTFIFQAWVWGQKRVVRIAFGYSISCSESGVVMHVLVY
jgi:MFS family permease